MPATGITSPRLRVIVDYGGAVGARRRDGGRKAQDARTTTAIISGMLTMAGPSRAAAREAAAPVRSKIIPAYAHSFKRGRRGATTAIAPRTFHVPKMVRKYAG